MLSLWKIVGLDGGQGKARQSKATCPFRPKSNLKFKDFSRIMKAGNFPLLDSQKVWGAFTGNA